MEPLLSRASPTSSPLPSLPNLVFEEGPLIGRGAFGLVNLAIVTSLDGPSDDSLKTGTLVAVKQIPCPDDDTLASAHREALALRACRSCPSIVQLHGLQLLEPSADRPNTVALLVMEYLPGGTLAQLASVWGRAGGQLAGPFERASEKSGDARGTAGCGMPEGLVRIYVRGIVAALAHIHALGFAHRDVKGANVLLTSDRSIRLADFGSCKLSESLERELSRGPVGGSPFPDVGFSAIRPTTAISSQGVSARGTFAAPASENKEHGTIAWMAPEVVKRGGRTPSASPVSAAASHVADVAFWQRADIWSLGATVLELLTGAPPWHGEAADSNAVMLLIASEDIRARVPRWVSPEALDFLCACFDAVPEHRPSAAMLAEHPFLCHPPDRALFARGAHSRFSDGAPTAPNGSANSLPHDVTPFSRYVPAPDVLFEEGVPLAAVLGALRTCGQMKTELRLACKVAAHWFAARRATESGWVDQCHCLEERVSASALCSASVSESIAVAATYGDGASAAVEHAATFLSLTVHRGCVTSVLFGTHDDAPEWMTQPEGAALLAGLADAPSASVDTIGFSLFLLYARIFNWVELGVVERDLDVFYNPPPPTLTSVSCALHWLAAARDAIAARADDADDAEDSFEGAAVPAQRATLPDFTVLFFSRLHVWVIEIEVALRALAAIGAWWPSVMAGPPLAGFDLTALARLHEQLVRRAYARMLFVRRTWEYGKLAPGFGRVGDEK